MIVLDTNVISEAIRPQPDRSVAAWLASQPASSLFITTITEAELLFGLELLPAGRRRQDLAEAIEAIVHHVLRGRLLPFDSAAAPTYATIAATRRTAGRPIGSFDAQIAAIARSRGASVATRNVTDFDGCGIDIIDPWAAPT